MTAPLSYTKTQEFDTNLKAIAAGLTAGHLINTDLHVVQRNGFSWVLLKICKWLATPLYCWLSWGNPWENYKLFNAATKIYQYCLDNKQSLSASALISIKTIEQQLSEKMERRGGKIPQDCTRLHSKVIDLLREKLDELKTPKPKPPTTKPPEPVATTVAPTTTSAPATVPAVTPPPTPTLIPFQNDLSAKAFQNFMGADHILKNNRNRCHDFLFDRLYCADRKEHIDNVRALIATATQHLTGQGRVIVIGPSLILPLLALGEKCHDLILMDIDTSTLKTDAPKEVPKKALWAYEDLTGGMYDRIEALRSEAEEHGHTAPQFVRNVVNFMLTYEPAKMASQQAINNADVVISCSVSYPIYAHVAHAIHHILEMQFSSTLNLCFDDDPDLEKLYVSAYTRFKAVMIQKHFDDLSALTSPQGTIVYFDKTGTQIGDRKKSVPIPPDRLRDALQPFKTLEKHEWHYEYELSDLKQLMRFEFAGYLLQKRT